MTGAPRLVTVTRSPDWTMRTYSLNWFFSTRIPTVFILRNVASCGYIFNGELRFLPGEDCPRTSPGTPGGDA